MRELLISEVNSVSGAGAIIDSLKNTVAYVGLGVSVATIIFGAITGVPTLGLGFVVMSAGIVGTVYFGKMLDELKDK